MNSLKLSLGILPLVLSTSVNAALVQVAGDTVDFIYDTDTINPLYGSLQVVGDTIFALPTNLGAASTDGVAVNTTGSSIDFVQAIGTIQIVVHDGYSFDGINVSERGNYNISNGGPGIVDIDASLRVFDWNNAAPITGTEDTTNLISTNDFTLNDGINHEWTASGGFDLTTTLWNDVNHLGLTLDNTFTASSSAGNYSWINSNAVAGSFGVSIATTVIPVPAAVWLFGSGLIGLAGFARRKKA